MLEFTFPPDDGWLAIECAGEPVWDASGDGSGAADIVGDAEDPAGFFVEDDNFLFVRVRVDDPPANSGAVWGFLLDTDDHLGTYEVLLRVDEAKQVVELLANSETVNEWDPSDLPDEPPVVSFPFESAVRVVETDTQFQGTPDFFVDLATPWSMLDHFGVTHYRVWLATSNGGTTLDGDHACTTSATDGGWAGGGGHCAHTPAALGLPLLGWIVCFLRRR